ncbi:MAG: McrC family protein, partial [Campylobacterales bacterium]|nr:McrC family protein [Campylobacterales bacterium]
MKYIYEYDPVGGDCTSFIKRSKELHKYFKPTFDGFNARQYCGILSLDGEDLFILPKIAKNEEADLNIFIYMLIYTYDIKLENEQISSCKNEPSLILEVFIQLFAKNLFKEFQHGIYKEYMTEQDNLTTLRGKYLVNENLKYNFTKNKIYCEYDEFSMNNELNQFFLFAVKTLLRFVKDKKILKQCELVLDEVEFKNFDINKVNFHFNRLNKRFQNSFEFALLLLNRSVPLFEKDKKSFAFLFDMNLLFEKFVGKLFQSIDSSAKLQSSIQCGKDFFLKPDIVLDSIIIDTKYKILKD